MDRKFRFVSCMEFSKKAARSHGALLASYHVL
jgi:hypothetical protein